jgi:hypothetical protein
MENTLWRRRPRPKATAAAAFLALAALAGAFGCRNSPAPPSPQRANDSGRDGVADCARRLSDPATRAEVARELGAARVRAAVEPLRAAAKDADPVTRAACLWALGRIGDVSAAPAVAFYVHDKSIGVRLAACEALGSLPSPRAFGALREAMEDADASVRSAAVRALGGHDDRQAVQGLVRALRDEDAAVRSLATEHVMRVGVPAFRQAAGAGWPAPPQTLARIATALAKDEASEAVPLLVSLAAWCDRRTRPKAPRDLAPVGGAAMDALVSLGPAAVEPLCRRALGADAGLSVKIVAAEALERIASGAAVPHVTQYVLGWKKLRGRGELALWENLLRAIGGEEAERALAAIDAHVEAITPKPTDAEIAAALLSEVRLAPPAAAAKPDPAEGIYALVLVNALPGGRPLVVHLDCERGRIAAALATSPTFNKSSHDVDASGLRPGDGRLAGTVNVTVHPDAWVPADGKPIFCAYTIDAAVAGCGVRGTFEGTCGQEVRGGVWGLLQDRGERPEPARFHLRLEDALGGTVRASYHHRAHASFTLMGGKSYDGRFTEQDQTVPLRHFVGWSGTVRDVDVAFDGRRLTGTIHALVQSARSRSIRCGRHSFTLDGLVIGKVAAGQFRAHVEGSYVKTRRFVGIAAPAVRPEVELRHCQLALVMRNALMDRPLTVRLHVRHGAIREAFTVVGNARCGMDASALTLKGRTLRGELKAAVRLPGSTTPLWCTYRLEADARHPGVSGSYRGTCGQTAVGGTVSGALLHVAAEAEAHPASSPPPRTVGHGSNR